MAGLAGGYRPQGTSANPEAAIRFYPEKGSRAVIEKSMFRETRAECLAVRSDAVRRSRANGDISAREERSRLRVIASLADAPEPAADMAARLKALKAGK